MSGSTTIAAGPTLSNLHQVALWNLVSSLHSFGSRAHLAVCFVHCRMYATAAARSDGLLLLCGGRDIQGTPLADAYGFARHRDGRWEWHMAPGQMPSGRYQHGAVFVGARLHISGGAVGGGRMVRRWLICSWPPKLQYADPSICSHLLFWIGAWWTAWPCESDGACWLGPR